MEFKLFVSNVPYNCTEEEFRTFMLTFDGVKDVKLIVRQNTTINKGFGFVTVTTMEVHDGFMENETVIFNFPPVNPTSDQNSLIFITTNERNFRRKMGAGLFNC